MYWRPWQTRVQIPARKSNFSLQIWMGINLAPSFIDHRRWPERCLLIRGDHIKKHTHYRTWTWTRVHKSQNLLFQKFDRLLFRHVAILWLQYLTQQLVNYVTAKGLQYNTILRYFTRYFGQLWLGLSLISLSKICSGSKQSPYLFRFNMIYKKLPFRQIYKFCHTFLKFF